VYINMARDQQGGLAYCVYTYMSVCIHTYVHTLIGIHTLIYTHTLIYKHIYLDCDRQGGASAL